MSTSYIFTYVNDQDIESFLENKTNYANKIAFLGSSGLISTHNQIYGDATKNDVMSYINDNYVSKDELSQQSYAGYSYVYDAYNYVLGEIDNMILPTMSYRTALCSGWTGKEASFLDAYSKEWDKVENGTV